MKLPIAQDVFDDGLSLGLPHAYLQFLKEIGKALLYRSGDGYLVGVYPISEEIPLKDKDIALCFGHCTTGKAYFLRSTLSSSVAPVHKKVGGEFIRSEPSFESWIKTSMELARRQFGKKEWERILMGPKPFNKGEQEIVASRRMFQWRLIGETDNGMARFEVANNSAICLPYLSIGIREIHGKFDGGVWLDVSHIRPGNLRLLNRIVIVILRL